MHFGSHPDWSTTLQGREKKSTEHPYFQPDLSAEGERGCKALGRGTRGGRLSLMSKWTRRSMLSSLAAAPFALQTLAFGDERPAGILRVGKPIPLADNQGDTWVATWADDGNLYSPSDDTSGFHSIGMWTLSKTSTEEELNKFGNLAFNRLEGDDPLHLKGTTVNRMQDYGWAGQKLRSEGPDGCTWKSSGCSSIDGVIYWVVARHKYGEKSGDPHRRQPASNASIIKSADFGKTWRRSAEENYDSPMFPGSRFATPYFIDYGRSQAAVDGADHYVYAISNNGYWDNGDDQILGRVLRTKIGSLNSADWEFFTSGDGKKSTSWSPHMVDARPVLERPGRLGMTGAVYLPAQQRYLMIGWYYPAGGGKIEGASSRTIWDFFEAPHPWGPWTKIYSHEFSPQGYYSPEICPKFQSVNRFYVLTAGDFRNPKEFYRLTLVPVEIGSP
jgi:hypothetical protein